MVLKPQDVLVLLKITVLETEEWSYASLAQTLLMSVSEVHAAVKRAESARLIESRRKTVLRRSLAEFLVHGVKYAYPPERGAETRGMPTGYAAPPLVSLFGSTQALPPVWPTAEGSVRGYEFSPLYPSVPSAASLDNRLYEMLSIVDAIREGRARDTELAVRALYKHLHLSAQRTLNEQFATL